MKCPSSVQMFTFLKRCNSFLIQQNEKKLIQSHFDKRVMMMKKKAWIFSHHFRALIVLETTKPLCSRIFQNVKLSSQLLRIYVNSNFGKFKRSKLSILAILEVLNLDVNKFEHFLKSQIYLNSKFIEYKIVKVGNFWDSNFPKIDFT